MDLMSINWRNIFTLDLPLLEIFIRGSIMYLGIFFMLRIVLRREAGSLGTTDFLMITVLADAAQNGMASQYQSVTSGLFLVLTIIFWDFFLDYLAFQFRWAEKLIRPAPVRLINNGAINRKGMRQELLTQDELCSLLREQGVEKVEDVKRAWIESNGQLSVIKNEK